MCGIWAVFGADPDEVFQFAPESFKVRHRGPDASRFETIMGVAGACFGFHHLSIMDHQHGMQPLRIHKNSHLHLIYNGEIYNYKQLAEDHGFKYETESDGESILHLYAESGIQNTVTNLDGMFALCLLDTQSQLIHIARDPYGIKPLFKMFHAEDGTLAISSEAKGLSNLNLKEKTTIIEHVQPGCYETYQLTKNGRVKFVRETKYFTIGDFPTYADATDISLNIRLLLKAAVRKRMMANRRVGCLLSGGLDSSLVAALLMELSTEMKIPHPIQTFSVGFEGAPDMLHAQEVAQYIGSEHHEIVLDKDKFSKELDVAIYSMETYEAPILTSGIGTYILCKYIRENTDTTVVLSGEGSDELCQGYWYFHNALGPEQAEVLTRHALDMIHYNAVLRCDRISSAHGLEVRVPFLDAHFTAYYLSLPVEQRMPRAGIEKYLLREAFNGTKLIPDKILWRKKLQFGNGLMIGEDSSERMIEDIVAERVNENWKREVHQKYKTNTPRNLNEYYMRTMFDKYFPGQHKLTKCFFIPENTISTDDQNLP